MDTYEYKGVVEEVFAKRELGMNGFTKRDVVIGNDIGSMSKFPNPVLFTFKKDNCSLLDPIRKGDRVNVRFVIDGRRWDGPNGTRYFTDLTGLKIEVLKEDGSSVEPVATVSESPSDDPLIENEQSLPF